MFIISKLLFIIMVCLLEWNDVEINGGFLFDDFGELYLIEKFGV